jgi:hypothetical protein
MMSEVVEETSEGMEGTAAKGAAKEPNQYSNCFMSRVTVYMVAGIRAEAIDMMCGIHLFSIHPHPSNFMTDRLQPIMKVGQVHV